MIMEKNILAEKLAGFVKEIPTTAEVVMLRQHSLEGLERRAKRFLAMTGEACKLDLDRGDWRVGSDRTLVHLPGGARAEVHHASGALRLMTGIEPMTALFGKPEPKEALTRRIEEIGRRLSLTDWVGRDEALKFERLWQIKAAAADREGRKAEPVLCRAVGAYRHFVNGLPVWGPASVALKLAGDGRLDTLSLELRETDGAILERPKIISPDRAAEQIVLRLAHLMGKSRVSLGEMAVPRWMQFGYLSLPKRKAQRVLAPAYVAAVGIEGQKESQAYLFAVPATDKAYLNLGLNGAEALPAEKMKAAARVAA